MRPASFMSFAPRVSGTSGQTFFIRRADRPTFTRAAKRQDHRRKDVPFLREDVRALGRSDLRPCYQPRPERAPNLVRKASGCETLEAVTLQSLCSKGGKPMRCAEAFSEDNARVPPNQSLPVILIKYERLEARPFVHTRMWSSQFPFLRNRT